MDAAQMSTARPPAPAAPMPVADNRPTADAAAIARDPNPELPMPIPASLGQAAAITQSRISPQTPIDQTDETVPVERVLKPFGLTMLPYSANEGVVGSPQSDADAEADSDQTTDTPVDA